MVLDNPAFVEYTNLSTIVSPRFTVPSFIGSPVVNIVKIDLIKSLS